MNFNLNDFVNQVTKQANSNGLLTLYGDLEAAKARDQEMMMKQQQYEELKQKMEMARLQEARTAQMHPLEMQGKQAATALNQANAETINLSALDKRNQQASPLYKQAIDAGFQKDIAGAEQAGINLQQDKAKQVMQKSYDSWSQAWLNSETEQEREALANLDPKMWEMLKQEAARLKEAQLRADLGGSGNLTDFQLALSEVRKDPKFKGKSPTEQMEEAAKIVAAKSAGAYTKSETKVHRLPDGTPLPGPTITKENAATSGQAQGNKPTVSNW